MTTPMIQTTHTLDRIDVERPSNDAVAIHFVVSPTERTDLTLPLEVATSLVSMLMQACMTLPLQDPTPPPALEAVPDAPSDEAAPVPESAG